MTIAYFSCLFIPQDQEQIGLQCSILVLQSRRTSLTAKDSLSLPRARAERPSMTCSKPRTPLPYSKKPKQNVSASKCRCKSVSLLVYLSIYYCFIDFLQSLMYSGNAIASPHSSRASTSDNIQPAHIAVIV